MSTVDSARVRRSSGGVGRFSHGPERYFRPPTVRTSSRRHAHVRARRTSAEDASSAAGVRHDLVGGGPARATDTGCRLDRVGRSSEVRQHRPEPSSCSAASIGSDDRDHRPDPVVACSVGPSTVERRTSSFTPVLQRHLEDQQTPSSELGWPRPLRLRAAIARRRLARMIAHARTTRNARDRRRRQQPRRHWAVPPARSSDRARWQPVAASGSSCSSASRSEISGECQALLCRCAPRRAPRQIARRRRRSARS